MQEVGKGVEEVWGLLVAHSVLSKRSSVSLRSCNNFLFQNKKKEVTVIYCENSSCILMFADSVLVSHQFTKSSAYIHLM